MLNLFHLLLGTLPMSFRSRRHLILEKLLLRHQLQVALRTRPRLQLRISDNLFGRVVRPHRALRLETPLPGDNLAGGEVQTRPILGGLHHISERAA